MLACISPAESNIEESINTLRYAERTRNIKNSAKINAVSAGSAASEAVALRRENQNLKLELARMESKLISFSNVSTGFSFCGSIVSGNMDSRLQLQAQCSSLAAEIELLKGRAQGHAQEFLEASLRADKWQAKSEAIALLAQEQGVDLSSLEEVASANDDLASQLRGQLAERKAELLEARTEAMVARATAGAIIAARGDLSSSEHIDNSESSLNFSAFEVNMESQNEDLTTELTAVSATTQQKEAMVMQMNEERACMDSINPHYENLLKQLVTEADALTAERNELMVKLSDGKHDGTKRKRKGNDPPMTKRLREKIGKLECRINELKVKANEHEKSMKMKEEAENKCAPLLAEIAEDKRRRADLQRKLKEASVEMRTEKKAAQQQASKLLKDSQQLKIELTKMENVAQKQAAVLKRKIDQASAKEKAKVELERKRRLAENMRLASSSNVTSQINETRKIELFSWVDHEFEYSLIKFEINDQRRRLENVVADRGKLMTISGDVVYVEELEEMDLAIGTLRTTVQDLETAAIKAFPTAGDYNATFRFLDTDKFKGLSKHDAAHILSYIFDKCLFW
jgi:DNA repair exonuclease SbcCD ATPase subunit